jgi:hypothetical protein
MKLKVKDLALLIVAAGAAVGLWFFFFSKREVHATVTTEPFSITYKGATTP